MNPAFLVIGIYLLLDGVISLFYGNKSSAHKIGLGTNNLTNSFRMVRIVLGIILIVVGLSIRSIFSILFSVFKKILILNFY